jgi:hypothetical protein
MFNFRLSQRSRWELFWVIRQLVVIIPYRSFGITCRSHLKGSRIQLALFTYSYKCYDDLMGSKDVTLLCQQILLFLQQNSCVRMCFSITSITLCKAKRFISLVAATDCPSSTHRVLEERNICSPYPKCQFFCPQAYHYTHCVIPATGAAYN